MSKSLSSTITVFCLFGSFAFIKSWEFVIVTEDLKREMLKDGIFVTFTTQFLFYTSNKSSVNFFH